MDPLGAALRHLDEASFAVRLVRPSPAAQSVARSLHSARDALIAALSPGEEEMDMERRTLIKLGTMGLGIAPMAALERLAAALRRVDPAVDDELLAAAADATHAMAKRWAVAPPGALSVAVNGHLERLTRLAGRAAMAPASRQRLNVLISDAAAFAGYLAQDLGRTASSRAHLRLAADVAREAGDGTLHALAIAAEALTYSRIRRGGDSRRTLWALRQAHRQLPATAPAPARAWIAAHTAKEHAVVGDAHGFNTWGEQAAADHARPLTRDPSGGFWSTAGFFTLNTQPAFLDDYLGRGLMLLDEPIAADVLGGVLRQVEDPRRRSLALVDLVDHHVSADELDAANTVGLQAVDHAEVHGLRERIADVRAARDRAGTRGARPMADLDRALTHA
jgi:hypothetical protein